MSLLETLRARRHEIFRIAEKHGARNVRVFGSAALGQESSGSDVDFLVEMEPDRSLMDMGALLMDLQELLGRDIDLVEPEALHWYIRDRVLGEAIPL